MSQEFFSVVTTVTLVIGLLITWVYLKYMRLALLRAVQSRDEPDDGEHDDFERSFVGAVIAVVVSSGSIAAFGWAPSWLYQRPTRSQDAALRRPLLSARKERS